MLRDMAQNGKIIQLQQLIQRHLSAPPARPAARFATGIPAVDTRLDGGLIKGGIVELVSPALSHGATSLLLALLRHTAHEQQWAALIDGSDHFDPQSAGEDVLASLLWVRCRTAPEALRCTDLLLRDGNLPLVVLDLRGNSPAELRRIPDPHWYRLQRALEPAATAFLALTPRAMIPCAHVRLVLHGQLGLEALEHEQEAIVRTLQLELTRQRASFQEAEAFAQTA